MNYRNHSAKEFLVGAAVGTLLGGISALLAAPASGQKVRKQIKNLYNDIEERAEDFVDDVSKKGKSLAKSAGSCSEWGAKAKCVADKLAGRYACSTDEACADECSGSHDILIGSALGGILGAVAGLLLAPKSGSELREDLVDGYEDVSEKAHDFVNDVQKKGKNFVKQASKQSSKWIDLAHQIADSFTGDAEDSGEEVLGNTKNRLDDAIEWASLGYRVWQGLNKRR